MWSGIKQGLDHIRVEELGEMELWSYRFLRHHLERRMRGMQTRIELRADSNPGSALAGFTNSHREGSGALVAVSINTDYMAFNLQNNYINEPLVGKQRRYDGSYAAFTWSNLVLGVGAIDRWWGPGWNGSMMLGNEARPAPGLFFHRKDSSSRLGTMSWDFNLFVSELQGDRFIENAKLAGARITLKPWRMLEIGLSNIDLSGAEIESQDDLYSRMQGFDWRLNHGFSHWQGALYHQYSQRDAGSDLIFGGERAQLLGMELSTIMAGVNCRFSLETQDTTNGELSIFDHGIYKDGYRHYRRNLATSIDTASTANTLAGDHYFRNGHQLSWRLGNADLNEDNVAIEPPAGHPLTNKAISLDYGGLTYKLPVNQWVQTEIGLNYYSEALVYSGEEISSGGYLQINIEL